MPAISVRPHTIVRRAPGYFHVFMREWVEPREWEERDPDFPFFAECESVSAIGRTEAGAVAMVERILGSGGAAPQPPEDET